VASYRVLIRRSAAREIEAFDSKKNRQRIVAKILELGSEPRPPGCERLVGEGDRYRVRVGRYRILNAIVDEELAITIVKVADRKDAYR
jgi:mRNA interferase RelE/StbE